MQLYLHVNISTQTHPAGLTDSRLLQGQPSKSRRCMCRAGEHTAVTPHAMFESCSIYTGLQAFGWEALVAQALTKQTKRTPDMHAWHALSTLHVRLDFVASSGR